MVFFLCKAHMYQSNSPHEKTDGRWKFKRNTYFYLDDRFAICNCLYESWKLVLLGSIPMLFHCYVCFHVSPLALRPKKEFKRESVIISKIWLKSNLKSIKSASQHLCRLNNLAGSRVRALKWNCSCSTRECECKLWKLHKRRISLASGPNKRFCRLIYSAHIFFLHHYSRPLYWAIVWVCVCVWFEIESSSFSQIQKRESQMYVDDTKRIKEKCFTKRQALF